jgi:hypothetical protein
MGVNNLVDILMKNTIAILVVESGALENYSSVT